MTFILTTYRPGDGAAVGPHRVSVRRVEMGSQAKPDFDYAASSEVPPPPKEVWLVPARFGRPDTSGLTATVTEDGPNEFTLELRD